MSKRPILVYGPPWSGTVDYARRRGWGIIVDKRGERELLKGILTASLPTASESIAIGYDVARSNHDIKMLRAHVWQRVNDIADKAVYGHN